MDAFNNRHVRPNQLRVMREMCGSTRRTAAHSDAPSPKRGLRQNIALLQYIEPGCAARLRAAYNLMEDAATAEIAAHNCGNGYATKLAWTTARP